MSSLAPALLESLRRVLPPAGSAAQQALLAPLITALLDALEQGELGLDLAAEPPAALASSAWPHEALEALAASGWLLSADALEAPLVHDGTWLRWRRWHELLMQCLERLIELAGAAPEPLASAQELAQA
ncbi:MAG: exodeoxyribonuclease V subunit alpha, partial [Cyanobacteria bacterium K_DeepCast_35m_m2_155]|nr:exodeoxyribonuclease V subunit alpha [Cyanobacteria bacterium K_DeepCast_35m_m2_155]